MRLATLRSAIARAEFESVKDRPDLFKMDESGTFGFPCFLCTHADTDLDDGPCTSCAHYTN